MLLCVLAIVINVLVLVQYITVQQMSAYVLETVMSVLVLVQLITVQQVMLFAQIQLLHVPVLVVAQCLIVLLVLILMVYADIQRVAVILVAIQPLMAAHVQLVKLVAVAPAFLSLLVPRGMVVQPPTIGATAQVSALHL